VPHASATLTGEEKKDDKEVAEELLESIEAFGEREGHDESKMVQ